MFDPTKAFEILLDTFRQNGGHGSICIELTDGQVVDITIQSAEDAAESHHLSEEARLKAEADTRRWDRLEALPWRFDLIYKDGEAKSGDMPSIRSQVDYFLDRLDAGEEG